MLSTVTVIKEHKYPSSNTTYGIISHVIQRLSINVSPLVCSVLWDTSIRENQMALHATSVAIVMAMKGTSFSPPSLPIASPT
jgi:hypothetical protein